jgi:hypothetical protein
LSFATILNFDFTRKILLGKSLVLSDVGRNHLFYLFAVEQHAKADAVDAAVVRNDGQVLDPGFADGSDQARRNPTKPKPAGHDHHAVLEQAGKGGARIRVDLLHYCALRACDFCKLSCCRTPRNARCSS